jgi:PAS domain S-box-containing protein
MVTAVALAWGILGYQLWDILPIARETVLASISDAVIVVDGRGRVAELNPAAQDVVGAGVAEAIGRPVSELWPPWKNLPSVDRAAVRTVLSLELHGEERHYDVTLAPLTKNLAEGCLVVLHDLTERRRTEERLRLQNVALEAATEAIMITTRAGRIVWVNSAFTRLTGYTEEEAVGKTPRLLRSGMHDDAFYKSLWGTILSGKMWRGEIVNRRKDGSLYTDEQGIAPVFDDSGTITHFVSIRHDVTQRKQVESLRASLTRTMVHDLRSPLTVIHGALEALDDGFESSRETRDDALRLSRKHTERLLHLVEAILEVQGLSSGTIPLHRRSTDPGALVAEAVRLATPLAETRGQRLIAQVSGQLPWFDVDPTLVGRVLENLIANALKFSSEGSAVTVGAVADAAHVRIEVIDEGPGVENELRPRLFQEFARGAGPGRGSGLGLAFCRLAVEAHSGGIGVDSEPGRGARFWFTLPWAVVHEPRPEPHRDVP